MDSELEQLMAEWIPLTGGYEYSMMSVFPTENVTRCLTHSAMKDNTGLNGLRGSEHVFLAEGLG